jgi:hypothetical protein
MRIIYCCPIQLGGEFSNYIGFLPPYSFPLPLPSSLPFSLPILGGCQISTQEAPLITEKAPCMYNSYIYSKDDIHSPFVKPPWDFLTVLLPNTGVNSTSCMKKCLTASYFYTKIQHT